MKTAIVTSDSNGPFQRLGALLRKMLREAVAVVQDAIDEINDDPW